MVLAATTTQFSDTVTTAIKSDEGKFMCLIENNMVSLPYSKVTAGTWRSQINEDIKDACGLNVPPANIFRVNKIWIPGQSCSYVVNVVLIVQLTKDMRLKIQLPTGKFANRLKWLSDVDLEKFYQQEAICTPVLLEMVPRLCVASIYPPEIQITNIITEISENSFSESGNSPYDIILEASGLKSVINNLYKEFMAVSFPHNMMSPAGFRKHMVDYGMPTEQTQFIFRAADISNRKFLSFKEYMYMLAVLEPTTNHGGLSAEVRCRYIFKFFDRDSDGTLCLNELRDIIIYMRKIKGMPVDSANVEKEQKAYCTSLNVSAVKPLTLANFLRYAGELKIRGLSTVLRLPKSIKSQWQSRDSKPGKLINIETTPKHMSTSAYAKSGNYEIAVHCIRVQKSGTVINLEDIWAIKEAASMTVLKTANITKENRRLSCEHNSQDSVCNEMIKNLRFLIMLNKVKSGNRGNRREQYMWGPINSSVFAQKLSQICNATKLILKDEPRLLDLRSPIYIMGDFHGNYGDLQYFEKMFWPLCPGFCPCNLLFLGDYVDRGNYGMEVALYLICYKFLYPQKMNFIRGNHEVRCIQKAFTFYTECVLKFGDQNGPIVWENINQVFDMTPLAAVVDGKIFCCHGGIPPPWLCPIATAINSIPVPLPEPDVQSALAWELMWNDPLKPKQSNAEVDIELQLNEGFAANIRRGTAHVFNTNALDKFLNVNGFSHVIRAHEMVPAGYHIVLNGKLITVFSSSKYNGLNNDAACILVDNGQIRFMRLDNGQY